MAKSRKKGTIIMNTTTSTSKSAVRFTLNFFEKTITGTKASFNKANKGFGPEYVLGYMASIENDITCARIILNGLLSDLSVEDIKERLRDTYV